MNLTKLDTYEAYVVPGVVRIRLDKTNDAQAVDILSELSRTDNMLFLDGEYYEFLGDSRIVEGLNEVYLELQVIRCDQKVVFSRGII